MSLTPYEQFTERLADVVVPLLLIIMGAVGVIILVGMYVQIIYGGL